MVEAARARQPGDLPRTVEKFDRWNAEQPERWEFISGVPVMMAPASLPHTLIKGNIFAALWQKLAGTDCRALVDGAEVRSYKLVAIPDVLVVCGELDQTSPTIKEPVLIGEVNSPPSERDDTQRKWQGYCLIPSVRHYLVVAQDARFVTLHSRTGPSSFAEDVYQEGVIELPAIGVSLSIDEIYEGVTLSGAEPDA